MSFSNWLKGRSPSVEILDRNGVRSLHLGGQAIQSAMRLATPERLELHYTRAMMAVLLFSDAPRDLLMIGLGGGTLARYAYTHMPDTRITVVELEPQVVSAARAWFGLPDDDSRLRVEVGDGLDYLEAHPQRADLLLMDAFEGHVAPAHLRDERACAACFGALRRFGILAVNFMAADPKLDVGVVRLAAAFDGRVLIMPTGDRANTVVLAFRSPVRRWPLEQLKARTGALEARFDLNFEVLLKDLLDHNACADGHLLLGSD